MLLLGAGRGEATCGLLYLAGFLRRNGVEAFVRLHDADGSDAEMEASLRPLLAQVKPKLIGLSLKWYHHVARALRLARVLKRLAPEVQVVVGGNSAAYWWEPLMREPAIDAIVQGDGEVPLLALARGQANAPNVVSRGPDGKVLRSGFGYVQGAGAADVHYSHFDEVLLSELDAMSFSGWVAPGKGCGEACLYCGGRRAAQRLTFGRTDSFLRPVESVRKDHEEIIGRTWQLRYDFGGGTADFLGEAWKGFDLSKHSTTYFLWGAPPRSLIDELAQTFGRVFLVLDIGCFSATQRATLMGQGLLKPCPDEQQLEEIIVHCGRHKNLELEICGISGLPGATDTTLAEERRLAELLLERDHTIGIQRLQSQPGAPVTEQPERFGMVSEAKGYDDFLAWFSKQRKGGDIPLIRFADKALDKKVERALEHLEALIQEQRDEKASAVVGATKLRSTIVSTTTTTLAKWLGDYRTPAKLRGEPVTVARSFNGSGLACAPRLETRAPVHPLVNQGDEAEALLTALDAFRSPAPMDSGLARLEKKLGVDPESGQALLDRLLGGRFLERA